MTTRALPEGRYGSARGAPRRWRRLLWGALAVVVSALVAVVAYINLGPAPIDAEQVSYALRPGNTMSVTINVTRDDPGKAGVCIVRVRDITGGESGRKEVFVPAGDKYAVQTTVVHSIERPVTAEVFGCSYSVPPYLSTP